MPSSTKLLALASALAYLGVGNAEVILVSVGEGGLFFSHPDITANPGDIINFGFGGPSGMPGGNHSVTQSADFSSPCLPKDGGFNSGFVVLTQAEYEIGGIAWQLLINDTEPIWYYCAQIGHCQGGMVGSINANLSAGSNETFTDFSSLARQATTASIPSTTGGGLIVIGHPSTSSTIPVSTLSVNPGGPVSTTTGPSVSTTPTLPTLPPSSATTASTSQTASNATLSSTTAASSVSTAAATPAAGRADLGLNRAGFIAACFMPAVLLLA